MAGASFDLGAADLPEVIPIFPLTGVLLLPQGRLPLNIFEPRYLAMISDALVYPRLIGMVQPLEGKGDVGEPPVYPVGCAGRIISFSETDDGRYLITLTGVARFAIAGELPLVKGYRTIKADWSRFERDVASAAGAPIDRARLLGALKIYFERHAITCDWDAIQKAPEQHLVTTLAMACPFSPGEKQALLEAKDLAERTRLLTALIEMGGAAAPEPSGLRH
ncbi:MAG TPA: LON peptidase substrate-binding domain-containing protein [Stellaceae bacterium]|nr:LON peptidase substrate-binding domain-containing protein [Stellaceae bacterium]